MRIALVTSPFVWVAITTYVMAGPMSSADLSNLSNSDAALVVESELVEDLDGNPVEVPVDFLTPSVGVQNFYNQIGNWILGLPPEPNPPVELPTSPPIVEPGVEGPPPAEWVSPPVQHTNVPEPTTFMLAISGLLMLGLVRHCR